MSASPVSIIYNKRVYYKVAILFTNKSILAEAPYPYYDWFRSLNYEKVLYLNCI